MLRTALLLIITAFSILALPLQAQERLPVLELLASDADARFGLFLTAIDAAGLADEIAALDNATLLAPTDQAMIEAMNFLGLSQQGFLADSAALAEILRLHILPERLFFRNLSAGASVDTLGGETVDFALHSGILWAHNARVSDVDNLAAFGVVVHVLDGLILPSVMQERASTNRAQLRVAHLLLDDCPIDLYLNGNPGELQGLEAGQLSGWMDIAAGEQHLAIAFAASGALAADLNVVIAPDSWVTLAVLSEDGGERVQLIPLVEDYAPLPLGQARLSFFNGIEGSTGLDLLADGQVFAGGVAFPGVIGENDGFVILPLPVATYDFVVAATANPEIVVLNAPDIRLRDGYNVFMAAVGTPASPRILILEMNVNVERAFAEERHAS